MKKQQKIFYILPIFLLLATVRNACPTFYSNDLLQSGKNIVMKASPGMLTNYTFTIPINFVGASWGIQVAVTTSAISNYNPKFNSGFSFDILASPSLTSNSIIYRLMVNNDLSWSSMELNYIACSRKDVSVGNFQSSVNFWVPATSNVFSVQRNISRVLSSNNYFVATFISGFSASTTQFDITVNNKAYNVNQKSLSISFYCSSSAISSITFTYIIYPVNNIGLTFFYNAIPQGMTGSYQMLGPVGFLNNNNITYSEWVVGDRYISCAGCNYTSSKSFSCILIEDCTNNYGNIWQSQCIFCPSGIIFQNGRCSQVCGPNQVYSNLGCNCAIGFTRVGSECINILQKICGTNQIYNIVQQKCVCSQGSYDQTGKLNCYKCVNGSTPGSDGRTCVCSNSSQFWNFNTNLCENRCPTNQQWINNTCTCPNGYSWFNQACRLCPPNSVSTIDQTACSCQNPNSYYSPLSNTCISCNTSNFEVLSYKKSGCTCDNGYFRDVSTSKCMKNSPQCKDNQFFNSTTNTCNCLSGLTRNANKICAPLCAPYQVWNGQYCICQKGTARYGKCIQCPTGSQANNFSSGCICTDPNQIFSLNTFSCIDCSTNYMPNPTKSACICQSGFQAINGVCSSAISTNCPMNQRMSGGKCICQPGYVFNNNNVCTPCPAGSQASSDQFICICTNGRSFNPSSFTCSNSLLPPILPQNSNCPNGQRMSGSRCICPSGYAFNLQHVCTPCPAGSQSTSDQFRCLCTNGKGFNQNTFSCNDSLSSSSLQSTNCLTNQSMSGERCVCLTGYAFNFNNICTPCPELSQSSSDQFTCICNNGKPFDQIFFSCNSSASSSIAPCPMNQKLNDAGTQCICSFGYSTNSYGVCTQCPPGSQQNIEQTKCVCPFGQKFIPSSFTCSTCPPNSYVSADGLSCNCNNGYNNVSGNCISSSFCSINQQMNGGRCMCIAGYAFYYGVCTMCPVGSQPTSDQTRCTCGFNKIFVPVTFSCLNCFYNSYPNADQLSCLCNQGYSSVLSTCQSQSTCAANQQMVAGRCMCNPGYAFRLGVCTQCPANSQPSQDQTICLCPFGQIFVPTSFTCTQCPLYSYASSQHIRCICNQGYNNVNGNCVTLSTCAANQQFIGGRCQCISGSAFFKGVCTFCPMGSTPSADQSRCICPLNQIFDLNSFTCSQCPQNSYSSRDGVNCFCNNGYNNVSGSCISSSVCSANQVISEGVCMCISGYAYYYGTCTLCPNNSQVSVDQSKCICPYGQIFNPNTFNCTECPINSYSSQDGVSCLCNSGYEKVNGNCVSSSTCSTNQYMSAAKSCMCNPKYAYHYGVCTLCPNNSQASGDQSRCICSSRLLFSRSEFTCSRCPPNSYLAADGLSCPCNSGYLNFNGNCVSSTNCSSNQLMSGNRCVCQYGFVFYNGVCTRCPSESQANIEQSKCICPFLQYFNPKSFTCVRCPPNAFTSKDGFHCQCNDGYTNSSGNCVSLTNCSTNQLMIGGRCQCFDGYAYYFGVCTQCPGISYPSTDQTRCICPTLQIFAWKSFTCTNCPPNSYPSSDQLSCLCNSGYGNVSGNCQPLTKCAENQQYTGNACMCKPGYAYRYGLCTQCPGDSVPSPDQSICKCRDNRRVFNPYQFVCEDCVSNSSPSQDQLTCVCDYGYRTVFGTNRCQPICNRDTQMYTGTTCVCKAIYFLKNGVCTRCPCPTLSTSDQSRCICTDNRYWDSSRSDCVGCPGRTVPSTDQLSCI